MAKSQSIKKAVVQAKKFLKQISQIKVGSHRFKSLLKRDQTDLTRLQELTPKLLEQILYWLKTGNVAQNKIITLWKSVPRAISKGKIGKSVEFGRKWVINCYQGGYVLLTAPNNAKISDQHCVVESLNLHLDNFEESPTTYATDRGMWSIENVTHCLIAGVKQIGIQPKGGAKSLVSQQVHQELKNRRAGIEPRIAHLKQRGLGKSRMKSDMGDIISGHRSALSYNITHLWRDLNLQALGGVN